MNPQLLYYKKSTICYYIYGTGPQLICCFHGYGEEGKSFEFLGNKAGNQYSLLAIDLPFHGKTTWKEGFSFTNTDLLAIIETIMEKHPENSTAASTGLILLGYSLGGRIALSLLKDIPGKIDKLVLLAPDGMKVNGWYWLATQTWAGNRLFALTMKKPEWFFGLLTMLNKLKVVNASIFKFVNYYIGNPTVRRQLYDRWTGLRKMSIRHKLAKSQIRKNDIAVRLIYGKHDRIIRASTGEKFKRGIEKYCSLTVIDSGHQVLQEKYIYEIILALRH